MTTLLLALVLQAEGVVQDRTDFIPDSDKPKAVTAGRHVMALVPRSLVLHDPREFKPEDASYVLSSSGGGYRWCYVPQLGGKLALATPDNTLTFGVTRSYSLVEVEITTQPGSPNGVPALVAEKMRVVDDSKEFPLQVHKVVAELRTKYETWLKDQQKAVDEGMVKARKDAKGDEKRTKPARSATILHVQWMEETQKLQVRFLTRVLTTDDLPRPYSGPRLGNPPAPFPITWGIDFGMMYEVDKSGALEKRLNLPIEPWQGASQPRPALSQADFK